MFSRKLQKSKKPLILAVLSTLGTIRTRLFPAIQRFCQYLSFFLLLTPYFNPVFISVTGTVAPATAQWEAKPRQTTLPSRFVNFPKIYPLVKHLIWPLAFRCVRDFKIFRVTDFLFQIIRSAFSIFFALHRSILIFGNSFFFPKGFNQNMIFNFLTFNSSLII